MLYYSKAGVRLATCPLVFLRKDGRPPSTPELDSYLLKQYEDRVAAIKAETMEVSRAIHSLKREVADLVEREWTMAEVIFKVSLEIRRLIGSKEERMPPPCAR